jgi:hypothetical protein
LSRSGGSRRPAVRARHADQRRIPARIDRRRRFRGRNRCRLSSADPGRRHCRRPVCGRVRSRRVPHGTESARLRLPNAALAVVDPAKLTECCLNPHHWRGRSKARVFAAVGIGLSDAYRFREALLAAALGSDAQIGRADEHGARYVVDFWFPVSDRRIPIRSAWIVRAGEGIPRLTSCYVL